MRLWSVHPEYLDAKGLVALWRESLLAKKVIEGKTAGYRNHPQLLRFYNCEQPLRAINAYLHEVRLEADRRGYSFDPSKYTLCDAARIPLTRGQLEYEYTRLLGKLQARAPEKRKELQRVGVGALRPHPLFKLINGPVEEWEKV